MYLYTFFPYWSRENEFPKVNGVFLLLYSEKNGAMNIFTSSTARNRAASAVSSSTISICPISKRASHYSAASGTVSSTLTHRYSSDAKTCPTASASATGRLIAAGVT